MKYLKALPNKLTKNVVSYKGKLNNYYSMSIIGLKLTQVHPLLKTFHEMERFCSNPSRSYSPTLQNSFEQDPKERNEHIELDWQYQTNCSNERNAYLILVSTILIIACFLFSKWHCWSLLHMIIHGRKVKTRGKRSGQGCLNKKKSTCKIWVSFKQT